MGQEFSLGRLVVGDQPLCSQFPGLFKIFTVKNLTISSILRSTNPFSWNLNFHRKLLDLKIEDLKRLMSSLSHLHLSPLDHDLRAWSLSSLGLFTIKSFFSVLSNHIDPTPSFLVDFVWKSQAPFKVKSFVWLVALKKVNTNDMLQLRRSYKALNPSVCLLRMESGETVNHIFLHCPLSLRLWHRLLSLAHMDWVPPRIICDMMIISYRGLGNSGRGMVLWQFACLALMWVVW